ncbi:MAG: sulfotransferase family protein [Solirubrobacterales bacterium]
MSAGATPTPTPFVVGMNRSGTTLLRMMLDAHPDLAIPPETHFVPDLIRATRPLRATPADALAAMKSHREWEDFAFSDSDALGWLQALERLEPGPAVRAFYEAYAAREGKPRWGEKTPRYVLRMPLIASALPEARFVHVVRDGRDVALSVLDRTVKDVDAAEVARRWRRKIERAREDAPTLEHYLEVRYEDLVANPRRVLERVCEFVELPFDEAILDYHARSGERLEEMRRELPGLGGSGGLSVERRMETHKRTTAPPDASRATRWREDMSAGDLTAFERVAGETLGTLGYSLSGAPSVAFLICVEAGQLEPQGILFARALRRFGGRFASCPIHAYAPREGRDPSAATREALEALGVEVHTEALNAEHDYYPFANKIYAAAAAERELDEDILVFCDSDTAFLSPPEALDLAPGVDVAVAPAFNINKGTTGPGHRMESYWDRVWEIAGVGEPAPFVETVEREKRIRGYFNAGILAARRSSGYCSEWLELWLALLEAEHFPDGKMMVTDQVAISAAVARRPERFTAIPRNYNFNIARRPFYSGELAGADLDEIVHVHYHQWFNRRNLLRDLRPRLSPETEQYRWLDRQLPLEPAIRAPLPRPGKKQRPWRMRQLEALRKPLREIGSPEK